MRFLKNEEEKAKCLDLINAGYSVKHIAEYFGTTQECIKFYQRLFQSEQKYKMPKPGRPRNDTYTETQKEPDKHFLKDIMDGKIDENGLPIV